MSEDSDVPTRWSLQGSGLPNPVPLPAHGRLVLGGAPEADVVLSGAGIDDVHCAIGRLRDGGWAVKDMGSEFGTMVNGKKVKSQRLAAGDVILLGSRRLNSRA